MENTNVQEVKMPITYDDLKKSLVDSGRPYDFAMIDRAYALAEKAHGEQRRRSGEPYICHPLAGDTLYGGSDTVIARHALHCAILHFAHPLTGKPIRVECPLPADMAALAETENLLDGWQLSSLPCGEDALT